MSKPVIPVDDGAKIYRLSLPPAGKGLRHTKSLVAQFRRVIELALVEKFGVVGPGSAKLVRTAAKGLMRAMQVDRALAQVGEPGTKDGPSWEVWQSLLDRSLKFEEVCDRALKQLGLDAVTKPKDPWDEVLGQAAPVAPAIASSAPEAAVDAQADGAGDAIGDADSQGDETPAQEGGVA
jgi:hypothetical protein